MNTYYKSSKDLDVSRAIGTIERAFLITNFSKLLYENASNEERILHTLHRFQLYLDHGGMVTEADDYTAVAVWLEPGIEHPDELQAIDFKNPRLLHFVDTIEECCDKYLGSARHYLLDTLARDPEVPMSVKGSVSKVVRPVLEKALKENVPVVLIAIDDHAKEVYTHWGFKSYHCWKLGHQDITFMMYNYNG